MSLMLTPDELRDQRGRGNDRMTEVAEILRELRAAIVVPQERRLWSVAEIADYSGYSASTIGQRYACRPDFPEAIRADTGSQPRWVAGEVMEWFEGKRRNRSA